MAEEEVYLALKGIDSGTRLRVTGYPSDWLYVQEI